MTFAATALPSKLSTVTEEDTDNMNAKMKKILTVLLMVAALALITGCAAEQTPYEMNDGENYNVSVKYDANGGFFTTNTSVIVDSYNVSEIAADANGKAQIALLNPDHAARGNDAFTPVNNGYFLAGWYAERTENEDGTYTYGKKWDFEQDLLEVDPNEAHTSAEPVLTLYAAWVPLFEIEFYSMDSGEMLSSMTFNPTTVGEILVPQWDEETGAIEMYDFPENPGYTFEKAYYDAAGTQAVETAAVVHPGVVDEATGTAQDPVMQLYVDWTEGEWYHIYNAEQFKDNASVSGNYVLHADLDFSEEIWPSSLMYGNFSGSIIGNGYTIRNVTVEQTNNSKVNAGLFGALTEEAEITNLNLENVTFTISSGTRVMGASFGLFAGSVSADATVSNVTITSGQLQIDSGCYFGTDDYTIGLLCGMGSVEIDPAGITWAAVGNAPESVVITVDGQDVSVEFIV